MLQRLLDIMIKVFFKIVKEPILLFFYLKVKSQLNRWNNVQNIQEYVLKNIIALSYYSEFGKKYNFNKIRSYKDFIKYLKISSYEDIYPFIKKIIVEKNGLALFNTEESIHSFFASSGTTGVPKLMPLTKKYIKTIKDYLIIWGTFMFLDHRETIGTKHLLIVSFNQLLDDSSFKNKVFTNMPVSSISCKDTTGTVANNVPSFIKGGSRVPGFVFEIENQELKMYLILRFSLLTKDIKSIITVSAYNLINFCDTLNEYKELLAKDLQYSGLSYPIEKVSEIDRKIIEDRRNKKYFKLKNKNISKLLKYLISQGSFIYPKDIWKNISLIATWTGGNFKPIIDSVKSMYGCSNIRDIGFLSTEGMFSIPVRDNTDEGILNLGSCFYEFVPEKDYYGSYLYKEDIYKNEDVDRNENKNIDKDINTSKSLNIKLAHELEVGKRYFMIITTFNGLFRYDQKDLIECSGMYGKVPMIRFISKPYWIADLTGEKLSSYTVSIAFWDALKKMNIKYFLLSVRPVSGRKPYYELIVEEGVLENEEQEKFRSEFESKICDLNFIYKEHLGSNKLKPMKLLIKPKEFWNFYKKEKSTDRYKHPFIIKNE